MEKRIELEKRGRPANQITELNLDNCRSTSIVGLTDEFTALETLSLINVGLTTLKGFPKLPSLKKLELSDNRISNGLNHLTTSENLTQLNLSGNRVKDLEELQPLKTLKNLIVLDLFNNEATNSENYRKNTFELIPSLKYLDGFDCNEAEALTDSDDDEDEDEVNGNESEEDEPFCINGIEIDLKELAIFEKRLAEKRGFKNTKIDNDNEIDDLDEYLVKLTIENKSKNINNDGHLRSSPTSSTAINDNCHSKNNDNTVNYQNCIFGKITEHENITNTVISDGEFKKYNVSDTSNISTIIQSPDTTNSENNSHHSISQQITFPLMVIKFLGILFLMNSILYSDSEGGEASEIEVESDCDQDDDDLGEIYNDDLVDDNSDYVEENVEDEEDVDDDESEDEDENDTSVVQSPPQPADAEAPTRGKKRKHDG